MTADDTSAGAHPRPWIATYPEGIDWTAPLDLTPVHELVLAMCDRQPDAIALDFLGGRTSYGELKRAITAFAGALQSEYGVQKGTRVAILLPNTPFYPVAYYGVLLAGGTVVNCNPLYTVHELSHIAANSGAELMITLDLKQVFEKAEALVRTGDVKKLIVAHFPTALPPVKRVLFSIAKRKDLVSLAASPAGAASRRMGDLIAANHAPIPVATDPHRDVAVQQYTGGTTGLPKGAMLSHGAIAANKSQIAMWGAGLFDPSLKIVAVLPFFHIFAMTVCLNAPLCTGGQIVMLPRFELKAFLSLLKRIRPNFLPAVPTLIQALNKLKDEDRRLLDCLELVVSGGAALPAEVRETFEQTTSAATVLSEGYGLTEASPVVCCAPFRGGASKPMSIGMPMPGTDVRFVDVENDDRVCGIGERGELQVKGEQVMLGYWDHDDATRDAFMDGWLRTGDVGYVDEDGYMYIVDRIKDLIIVSGFNIYPRTVEEALLAHEAVDEVNVIGVPDTYRGEVPVAFVKLRDGHSASEAELKAFVSDRLNKLEMPREIIFKDQLPKTLIGKLSKKELREEYKARGAQIEPA